MRVDTDVASSPSEKQGWLAIGGMMERSIRGAERSMSKTYLPYDPDQQLLPPAALQEWLPPDHLAYFISDVVDRLDLSAITARYEEERRGGPPYHPRMMVKVLLYGYCTGVASSRRIAQRLHEDIAFRVLAANNTPDFRTISDFRKDHLEALADLFLQVLELCKQAGLVKLGHVALDGTKVRANASKHKAMSYGRMKEKEGQLSAEVAELFWRAGEVDDDEDRRYGRDKRGDELPEKLAFRGGRLREIARTVDATDHVVCPGLIDMHAHSGLVILSEPLHEPKVRQGITTELIGVGGNSYAPFRSHDDFLRFVKLNAGLDGKPPSQGRWSTVEQYLNTFDRKVAVNIAYILGNSPVRIDAVGWGTCRPREANWRT